MKSSFLILLVLLAVAYVSDATVRSVRNRSSSERNRANRRELEAKKGKASFVRSKRAIFDCKQLNQACSGVINCCGTLQCYWEEGYNMFTDGKCVACVSNGKRCQRDSQCCQSLVCQKGKFGYVDGLCLPKKGRGDSCHENDQCLSGYCEVSAGQILSREEGKCT